MTTQQKKLVEGTDIELYDQAKWSRATVADGKWLQNETLEPISANDRILASAIHDTSANLTTYIDDSIDEVYENLSAISVDVYNKINYVSATVDNNAVAFQNLVEYVSGDLTSQIFNTSSFLQNEIDTSTQDLRNEISATSSYLQGEIDTLEAATDVVDVVGTHADLLNYNKQLTKDDIVKVLCDETEDNLEYYWRVVGTAKRINPPFTWTPVGSISPYYNKTEIDGKITTLSSTVSSNYLSANVTAVQSGHNIVISANPTEPKILIKTSDNVTFTGISATTLSATTAYGSSAKFDNISSTNLTALTAQGNSAKFTNISSTNLTALTASGNQASYTNISGTTLSGTTASINIDNLITAATAGAVSYTGKNGIQINDHDIMLSAKMSAVGNGITNDSAISLSSFKLSADTGIKFNATTDTLGISVSSSIINSAEAGASASAYITANSGKFLNSAHNAFSKVCVAFYRDASQGQHFNDVFNANNSSAEFKFKLGDDLFGERDSSDTFIITTNNTAITADAMPKTRATAFIYSSTAYTAAGNGITNPYTGYLSALYLSAGNGITFDTTDNKLGILVSSTLINSAKSGQYAYNIFSNSAKISAYGSNTSNSGIYDLSGGIKLSAGNNLTLIATGNNTIKIDAKDTGLTSISAGGNINSPSSYNSTLTLSAGTGIQFETTNNNTLKLFVNNALINSANSGQYAFNILSSKKISAVGPELTNSGYFDLSGGFKISAGNNLIISTGIDNTIKLNAKDTGLTSISAGGNINSVTSYNAAVSLSAGPGIRFETANNNILGIKTTYNNGNYIEINNTNNQINLSSNISAENMSADNIVLSKQTMGQGSYTANLTFSSMYMTTYGQPPVELIFDSKNVSALVPDQSSPVSPKPTITAINSWYNIITASFLAGNYVSAGDNQSITITTANSIPSILVDDVYYLI